MSYSIQDHIRAVWQRDPDLNYWIPVAQDDTNRLFEEGIDLSGVSAPYAVVIDTGTSNPRNLGDHAFFETSTLFVRIYASNRKQLLDLSRRFRLVFSNVTGEQTEDGCICMSRTAGRADDNVSQWNKNGSAYNSVFRRRKQGPSQAPGNDVPPGELTNGSRTFSPREGPMLRQLARPER